ncbi:MAG: stage V sporulation protein AC [Ruminococcaceae bacterium]|nr:stage V sporulation protein AC [Oscillospiraceae bacterium]
MDINKQEYKKLVKKTAPPSPVFKNCIFAFLFGGAICTFGQLLFDFYSAVTDYDKDGCYTLVSITIIFITAFLTGIGVFDNIAKHAGAGTLVPVTGFANSVVSPAIDTKAEGLVLGVGAKIFTVSGPVILYGILSGTLYGVILWIVQLI